MRTPGVSTASRRATYVSQGPPVRRTRASLDGRWGEGGGKGRGAAATMVRGGVYHERRTRQDRAHREGKSEDSGGKGPVATGKRFLRIGRSDRSRGLLCYRWMA